MYLSSGKYSTVMVGRGGFPGGSTLIDLPMQESQVLSLGQEDPLEKEITTKLNGNPLQYSCLGNPMDRGAYSPWGCKKSDTAEHTHTSVIRMYSYTE